MNNTLNTKKNRFLSAVLSGAIVATGLSIAPTTPAYAIYCSNCSTFYQQMFEYAEQVNTALNTADQLRTQIQQYNDMIKQGMQLPDRIFNQITADLDRVKGVYQDAQSLGRNISNLDSRFREQFKGYESYLQSQGRSSTSMSQQYKKWATQGLDNARTAMKAAGINTSSFASEDATLNQLVSRSQSAAGRMQAIQAGNEIAAQNVQQLQKLRDLVATQIQLQGNYMAQMQERQSMDDAFRDNFRKGTVQPTGRDKGF
ncbi:P-type conjugative transfer protein TrbJ [Acinetobacter baumannii]|uniref:P-type conjugative transfer protein TrbJ n=1 Tax=Acinetobacter baumannii TaxID=470 RepID=UPI0034E1A1B7